MPPWFDFALTLTNTHSRPQCLRFWECARKLWETLRRSSQNLAIWASQRMLFYPTKTFGFFFIHFITKSFSASLSPTDTQGQSVGSEKKARQECSSTGERAPRYRLSPSYFQKFKRMPAPDWAQKMLCIIVPNRWTVSPEFFSTVRTRRDKHSTITLCCDKVPSCKKTKLRKLYCI